MTEENEAILLCHDSKDVQDQLSAKQARLTINAIKPTFELKHGFFPSNIQQMKYILKLITAGSRVISKQKIDLIHANTLSPAIAASALGLAYNIPVVITFHHIESYSRIVGGKHLGSVHERLSRLFRTLYDKSILHLPLSCIHVVSNSTEKALREAGYRGNIAVVPNGLDLSKYRLPSHKISYEPYLLFIGRLVKSKNLGLLLDAFANTLRIVPHCKLIIVGDGPMRQEWQRQTFDLKINHKVEFKGYISEQQKIDLLARCYALVFPSFVEGFGIVILEAFALGKPVIASNIKACSELIRNDVDGFLLSPYAACDWTERMAHLLLHPLQCQHMGMMGQTRAERYQIKDVAKQMMLVYRKLLNENYNQKNVPTRMKTS